MSLYLKIIKNREYILFRYIIFATIILTFPACISQEQKSAKQGLIKQTQLPRVLIIGDSISIGYTEPVRKLLEGKGQVFRINGNGQHTGTGLKKLNQWLGDEKWDVIHFNWGLWDLCYRHPDSKFYGNRDKINGTITTTPLQYEENLRELVKQLKTTGAKLIWANTTPVPEGEAGRFEGDSVKYNAIAEKIMQENGVIINDLYSYILDKTDEYQVAFGDVHFTPEGYKYLAKKVATTILKELE